ncbi:MAG: hypothetical protein K9H84_06545 [Bacteroidales bacterium]|nr:hypothetical protein [Bacteroidales bacterium]
MKNVSVIILIAFMAIASTGFGQKAKVFYFKANLSCCQARACDQLEGNIKTIVEKHFTSDEVVFHEVKLANKNNKSLVKKYDAKSQTVVVVNSDKSMDISDLVANYQSTRSKEEAEQNIIDKIKSML